ncbi:hypothetical protein HZS_8147 [Henneguya salminicola]|nr:hypothetical protein HZS_8147 [Henneguya salminicola]
MDDSYKYSSYLKSLLLSKLKYFKAELQNDIYSTSSQIFHRYYKNQPGNFDPFIICCSSIYLACKIEEVPIKSYKLVEMICQQERVDIKNAIISTESHILESISYDISFNSPFVALDGILLELKIYHCFTSDFDHNLNYSRCIDFIKSCLLIQPLVHNSISNISKICPEYKERMNEKYNSIIKIINEFDHQKHFDFDIPIFEINEETAASLY